MSQKVTVCQPVAFDHTGAGYGNNLCKEVQQETCTMMPVATPVKEDVDVSYNDLIKTCNNRPVDLPKIECPTIEEEKCIQIPTVKEETVTVKKCESIPDGQECTSIDITLPGISIYIISIE